MKINEINRVGALNSYRNHTSTSGSNSVDKKNKPKDEVQISAEAKELLGAQVAETSSVNKIQQLKQAVSTGTYRVDAGQIAEKLLPFIN